MIWEHQDEVYKEAAALYTTLVAPVDDLRQIVCVTGSAGIGKSRLIAQWYRSEAAKGFRSITTACHACDEHFPLLRLADIVAQLAGLRVEGWPPRVGGDVAKAAAGLPLDDETRKTLVAVLEQLHQPPQELDQRWFEALNDGLTILLDSVMSGEPLCVVLEDIEWIDEASRGVVADVLAREAGWPLLVVFAAREPTPEWISESLDVETIHLKPLTGEAVVRLIHLWASPALLPASTVHAICDRAQGHPLFCPGVGAGTSTRSK